ncbi:MAG: WD40 repeat domain-containing protein [Leptolyngbyaceae cyanobacterium SM1_3_5]|nr:WD40 repeat domain-containing protein [Leptolyngbyaceae cyanobacterium SM1_3_5]
MTCSLPDSSRNYIAENNQTEREFEIQVVNASNIFASFQVELSIEGVDPTSKIHWYRVEPEICSKKPPGDGTKFSIVLIKSPVSTYGRTIPIRLNVFSIDSESLFDVQTLELSIEQPKRSLKVYLPLKDLKVYPGDKLDIPVLTYNLSPKFTQVALKLSELEPDWFVQKEIVKTLRVDAGDSQEVIFCCSPPRTTQTRSRVYNFLVEAEDQDHNTASFGGEIEVLPYGVVEFECPESVQMIPRSRRTEDKNGSVAHYPLQFTNNSNLTQQIALQILESGQPVRDLEPLSPLEIEPGAIARATPAIRKPRPWLGWQRHYRFEAVPLLTNAHSGESSGPVYADPNVQILDLKVQPIVPFWLQLLGALATLLAIGWAWWQSPPKSPHLAPVNSVRIIGNETTVVSGASDQKVWRWDASPFPWIINSRRLSSREAIAEDTGKAVRVIREIPQREEQIAVGLENGEIQLWQVSPPQQQSTPIFERSDRVFDLDFTPDSRFLFSGHGSGFVRRWERNANGFRLDSPELFLGSAISALSVIDLKEQNRSIVAIAGQYNKFVLWDWERNRQYPVTYRWERTASIQPVIGKYDYINSVAVAKDAPILAMADNRGFITLWNVADLNRCTATPNNTPCNIAFREQWQASDEGQSVRSVALSDDGCYLASTGDDGRVMLWLIGEQNRNPNQSPNRETIAAFPDTALRAVDIQHPASGYVLVAFNAPDNQVRLHRQSVDASSCPERSP